jgi:transcriptional regulator with GAF, ATPase, and Fis domain
MAPSCVATTLRGYNEPSSRDGEPSFAVKAMNSEALQSVSLAVAAERSVESTLARIVEGLRAQPGVALARVWLVAPGDICETCPLRAECPDHTRCLHLVASAGNPESAKHDWSRIDGQFRRFPLGVRKIGQIGASGEGLRIEDVDQDSEWIVRPQWFREERIRSFGGQPLVFREERLGVLGVFSREPIDRDAFRWLRMFADHAAIAIAHARALSEVRQLKDQLEIENTYLREEVRSDAPAGIIGSSAALARVLEQVAVVAPTTAPVLVQGESGTGKELVVRAIHERSPRSQRPVIKVNCASIPRELFESEFFGHVKGAFTGALRDRAGRFQAADGGTLFLDEVGEIPLDLQAKLLRVLQEGRFERVGDDKTHVVDVRIVAATNRDLTREIAAGRFREDLYYRLGVFPILLPPLRERAEDIRPLTLRFSECAAKRFGLPKPRLPEAEVLRLESYSWPGNVRELRNVVERAVILSKGAVLRFDDLRVESAAPAPPSPASEPERPGIVTESEWRRRERENLNAALDAAGGRVYGPGGAAQLLGIKPTTLTSRLKTLHIRRRAASGHGPRSDHEGGAAGPGGAGG